MLKALMGNTPIYAWDAGRGQKYHCPECAGTETTCFCNFRKVRIWEFVGGFPDA